MEKRYKRVDKIETKIQSAKLPYNAWKVLFLLDDDTGVSDIVSLLNEDAATVEQALEILASSGLVEAGETEEPAAVAEEETLPAAEEASTEPEPEMTEKEELPEETKAEPEAMEEELSQPEEVEKEEPEVLSAEKTETELLEQVVEDSEDATSEEIPTKAAEDDEKKKEDLLSEQPLADQAPAEEPSSAFDELQETEEAGQPEVKAEETEKTSFSDHDLDIQIPTEPETETTEKETLDVDFELGQPEVSEEEPEPEPEKPEPETTPAAEMSGDKKTILVIDDSIVIRKMVEIALEDEDQINIETSISGKEGLETMDKVSPDLVILDMMLPDINGVEILKTIKASKGIPVIMLSGKDSPQLVEKAKSEGADEFLPKPFRDDELVDKIKQLLGVG